MADKKRKHQKTQEERVVGYFDDKCRIVASKHCFTLQFKNKTATGETVWVSTYFYAWIGDAIRGYAKSVAKRAGKVAPNSPGIMTLLDKLSVVERCIKDAVVQLNKAIEGKQMDIVESAIDDDCEIEDEEEEEGD